MDRTDCHDAVIKMTDVSFSYDGKPVIDQVNFEVLQRDFVGIVGSNGAGKTTLLRMMVGLLKPSNGRIELFGEPIERFKQWDRIGYVPQKNALNPLFPATVKEVVLSGLYGRKTMFKRLRKHDMDKCDQALEAMRIADLRDSRIGRLSGGQQQRAFLARALVNNPDLLILDEPTVGIDAETQASFFTFIRHMHQHHRMTLLMVTHDLDMLQSYLGEQPTLAADKINFFIKHTHEPEDCGETSLTHPLEPVREEIGVF